MNAAVRKKSPYVEVGILLLAVVDSAEEVLVLKENAVLDILGDQCKILIDDPAAAHVHMADFGVAHLAVRQTYEKAGSIALLEGTFCHQFVHDRCLCHVYCVCDVVLGQTISVKNHQNYRFLFHALISFFIIEIMTILIYKILPFFGMVLNRFFTFPCLCAKVLRLPFPAFPSGRSSS